MSPPPPPREMRPQAERLCRAGWRAYPFIPGALILKGSSRPGARVPADLWDSLRQLEASNPSDE
jgi:hypothetical protein